MMIIRAALATAFAVGLLAAPLAVDAQQPSRVARMGYLGSGAPEWPQTQAVLAAFRQGLRERGYVEGQNIVIEYRFAEGKLDRLPDLAAELARLKPDLIFAGATPAALALQQATTTIPIVAPSMADPVADGLVASLARPGGNITGNTFLGPELVSKRLGLLKEALPGVSRVAALWQPGAYAERTMRDMLQRTTAAARTLGVQLQLVEVRGVDDFDRGFSTMAKGRPDALIEVPSLMFWLERKRIVDLAAKHRLPTIYDTREYVDVGGLISYGANVRELTRQGASQVDKILKGAKPADLPVEQPTKFELVINLKTAKALGLTIPPSVLARADEVIQ
jgi:putative ABC transport system substrate-binding protein